MAASILPLVQRAGSVKGCRCYARGPAQGRWAAAYRLRGREPQGTLGHWGDLARAVVEAGWDLNELRVAAMSLEEIFLQLTGEQEPAEMEAVAAGGQN